MFEKEYKPTATMEQYLAAIDENADFRDVSQLDEASVKQQLGKYVVIDNGEVVASYVAKYEAQDHAKAINDKKKLYKKSKSIKKAQQQMDEASHRQDFMQLNPDMNMGKKMAIATAIAKRVAEATESKNDEDNGEDIIKRDTQGKVISYRHEGKWHHDGEKKDGRGKVTHMSDVASRKMEKLTKEELELEEGMISYSDFTNKIKSHRAAGNKIVDDKYQDGKASYTVIDSEGVGKKITHTHTGSKQEHLGNMKGDDDQAIVKTQEKRGRGRPVGSKSGARR